MIQVKDIWDTQLQLIFISILIHHILRSQPAPEVYGFKLKRSSTVMAYFRLIYCKSAQFKYADLR